MVRRLLGIAVASMLMLASAHAQTETRLALVLGTGAYQTNPMPNALNDAGLVARTLRDLGFSTVEGADLPQAELRQAIANFIAQLREAGPDAVVVVYLSGLAVQHESDSYLLPSDAVIQGESDVPIGGVRLNDLVRALAAIPSRAKLVLLDVSRAHPFADVGAPVRPGIGLLDAAPGLLIASAAAPGAVSAPHDAAYGHFATALAEQLSAPGLPVDQAVARARLRVHQLTNGRDTPWETARLAPPVPVLNAGEPQATAADPAAASARRRSADGGPVGAGGLCPRHRARHDRGLSGVPARLSGRPAGAACQAAAGHEARGAGVAPNGADELAAGLLDLSAHLSPRAARRGGAPAPRPALRARCAAAGLR